MAHKLPEKPKDLSVKPLQHGYSISVDHKHEKKYVTPARPYFNEQINNPLNNGLAKVQAFIEGHTDEKHIKDFAKRGAKWIFNNYIKKQLQ